MFEFLQCKLFGERRSGEEIGENSNTSSIEAFWIYFYSCHSQIIIQSERRFTFESGKYFCFSIRVVLHAVDTAISQKLDFHRKF